MPCYRTDLLGLVTLTRTWTFFELLRKLFAVDVNNSKPQEGSGIAHSPWTQWAQVYWSACLITELCPPPTLVPCFYTECITLALRKCIYISQIDYKPCWYHKKCLFHLIWKNFELDGINVFLHTTKQIISCKLKFIYII